MRAGLFLTALAFLLLQGCALCPQKTDTAPKSCISRVANTTSKRLTIELFDGKTVVIPPGGIYECPEPK